MLPSGGLSPSTLHRLKQSSRSERGRLDCDEDTAEDSSGSDEQPSESDSE